MPRVAQLAQLGAFGPPKEGYKADGGWEVTKNQGKVEQGLVNVPFIHVKSRSFSLAWSKGGASNPSSFSSFSPNSRPSLVAHPFPKVANRP